MIMIIILVDKDAFFRGVESRDNQKIRDSPLIISVLLYERGVVYMYSY